LILNIEGNIQEARSYIYLIKLEIQISKLFKQKQIIKCGLF